MKFNIFYNDIIMIECDKICIKINKYIFDDYKI